MKKIYDRRNIFTFPARGGRGPDLGYDDDDDTLGDDSVGGVNDDGEGPDDDVPDYAAMSVEELKAYRDDLSAKLAAERESGAELKRNTPTSAKPSAPRISRQNREVRFTFQGYSWR